ncbi:MAG: hypothetical protein JW993_17955 [Sedimentisphaerales bacterium]|nr:hypothetical protein [Sedimentisphaerales bacterium]
MAVFEARPKSLFSWGYELRRGTLVVARMDMTWLSEGGSFTWEGIGYRLSRQGFWSGDFLLEGAGQIPARATKPSPFRRHFEVHVGPRVLALEAVSPLTRAFRLLENGSLVGAVTPRSFFSRCCTVDFPDDLPVPVQVFLFWLVVLMWRRAANSSAAGAS